MLALPHQHVPELPGIGRVDIIRAALLYADLRGFTAMSEATEPAVVITALDAGRDLPAESALETTSPPCVFGTLGYHHFPRFL